MNDRRLSSFIDALTAGRRPGRFKAGRDDVEVLRAAIALRAARPGDAIPDEQFVEDLFHSLAEAKDSPPTARVHPIRASRARTLVVAVAACLVLIGGTVAATESFKPSSPATAAIGAPRGGVLRTGTFETSNGEVLGQIVAYNGHPSWVFLNVGVSQSSGRVICKLQLDNGSIVAAGIVEIHRGTGALSKTINVDIHRLRGAKLYNSRGGLLASATFAA